MRTKYNNKLIASIIFFFSACSVFAQTPEAISYQAVVMDTNGDLVKGTAIGMQISILQGGADGTVVYTETQAPTTSSNGLVSIEIGEGTSSDDFSAIDWSSSTSFAKIEIDLDGGTNYTLTTTSQLLSVPYALCAKTVESYAESDPEFGSSVAANITAVDTIKWSAKLDSEIDGDTTNELQTLSINGDTLFLSNGNYVNIGNVISDIVDSLTSEPTYEVGDQDQGGTVIYVTKDGKHGVAMLNEDLEYEKDDWFTASRKVTKLNYYSEDAKQYLNWRLPTVYEIDSMLCKNYDVLKSLLSFSGGSHATSDETIKNDGESYPNKAENYDFDYYGGSYFWYSELKSNPVYIRPVRTF